LHVEQLIPFLTDRGAALEGWCRRADGSVFRGWVASLSTDDALNRSNDACQVFAVSDITARYVREQAAQRVRERLDAVTTGLAHLAFFSIDTANDTLDLWGATSEVIGHAGAAPPRRFSDFLELVREEDRARLQHEIARASRGAAFELEVRLIAELDERWLLLSGSLVDGSVPRVVGAGMNVTRQRQSDEVLRATEARMHALLEATSDGVMTIDASGSITSLNPAAVEMFRAGNLSFFGAPWVTLLELASDEWPASGTLQEAVGRRVDGTTFACECRFTEVRIGNECLTLVMMRDLTHRRSVERQVLDATEQLQRQIGRDLHDGLGQLLTGTAFLAKGLLINLAHEHHPQAQRLVELITLAIARVRSLARGLSPIPVEARSLESALRSTLGDASDLLGVRCELKLVDFIDDAPPAAITQLCLIAREAITNAVRHGHAQNIVVRLSRYGVHSMLSVEDDGIGIGDLAKTLDGVGLRSMRYRAKMIDGKLDVVRTRGGTTIRCTWTDP
jgi:signal transduction histidine kinase